MMEEQKAHSIKKAEQAKRKKVKREEDLMKKAAMKKITTEWKLQKRVEAQSKASMIKLRAKFVEFRTRLLKARKRKADCNQYISGRKEVNVEDPLDFLSEEELGDELEIP